jgi:hypothetical protein
MFPIVVCGVQVTIVLRAGVHRVASSIVLSSADSGLAFQAFPVRFKKPIHRYIIVL